MTLGIQYGTRCCARIVTRDTLERKLMFIPILYLREASMEDQEIFRLRVPGDKTWEVEVNSASEFAIMKGDGFGDFLEYYKMKPGFEIQLLCEKHEEPAPVPRLNREEKDEAPEPIAQIPANMEEIQNRLTFFVHLKKSEWSIEQEMPHEAIALFGHERQTFLLSRLTGDNRLFPVVYFVRVSHRRKDGTAVHVAHFEKGVAKMVRAYGLKLEDCCVFMQLMAAENVVDWLPGDAVIEPVTRPVSYEMKLWEFISNTGTTISLRHDLSSHVCWALTQKSVKRRNLGGNTYTMGEWFDRLPPQIQDRVQEHHVLLMPRLHGFDVDTNTMNLPLGRAWKFNKKYAYTTSKIAVFRQLLNGLTWDRVGVKLRSKESASRSAASYVVHQIHPTAARHCSYSEGVSRHEPLGCVCPGTYAIFIQTQLLIHLPPPAEYDPFAEVQELDRGHDDAQQQQCDKHVRGSSNSRAPDMIVVIGKPEHGSGASFSFILDSTGQPAQGMLETHLVSIADYNKVSQLYKVACLKLAVRASMAPPVGRDWGAQHGSYASCGARRWPIIIEESKDSGSQDSEETESNIS
ncbi:hypothetical protein JCGZ_10729 [Jatropha curcas]|uniref:Uncharacterized protein n=1 Tax=Jatropha curcas TaxID=180498 RepID=A0A067KI54_JATCU|nr:hypothetical protein JCGZ_10729 [Jatropha curcas]